MFASVWSFVRRNEPTRRASTLSIGAMVLAPACKRSVVVVPVLIVLFDVAFASGGPAAVCQGRKRYAAHLAVVGIYLLSRIFVLGGIGDLEARSGTLPAVAYAQPWVLWNYIRMSLVPVGLSIDHAVLPGNLSPVMEVAAFIA